MTKLCGIPLGNVLLTDKHEENFFIKHYLEVQDVMNYRDFVTSYVFSDLPSSLMKNTDFMKRTLNFIFVRNPFTRISSAYLDAMPK